ncbi:MAG TPA: histidine kinase [Myxococcaceae bacterium]
MIQVALTRPFAWRLLPLVLVATGLFAVVVPLAHHLDARSRAVVAARERGERVAHLLGDAARDRPLLWRYDAAELAGRLQQDALLGAPVVVRDRENRPVPLGGPTASSVAWARVPVEVDGVPVATVWSGAPLGPLRAESLRLLAGCLVLAAVLGTFLFLFPVRTVARAEERIAALLAERRVALQDEERRRIARELHDGAGQALTAARLQLLALRKRGLAPEDAAQVNTTSTRPSTRCGGRPRPSSPRRWPRSAFSARSASTARATRVRPGWTSPSMHPRSCRSYPNRWPPTSTASSRKRFTTLSATPAPSGPRSG